MLRRKKDDKRVLKPRYSSHPQNNKRRGRNNSRVPGTPRTPRKPRKTSRGTLFFIILVLVAFVIGAGIGVSLALGHDDDADQGPHVKNVTKEMTNNLTKNPTEFDYEMDYIDYNNLSHREEYNITYDNSLNY